MKRKPYIKCLLNLINLKSFCQKKRAWIIIIHHEKREGLITYEIYHSMIDWVFTKDKDYFKSLWKDMRYKV